tara:strand:- start:39 stop:446 length:408 start_codon:yes stop_codon:yes gene_type:complete
MASIDGTTTEFILKAEKCEASARESRARCGSDGFVSQSASDEMADRYRTAAAWVKAGHTHEFSALLDGEREVDAKLTDGKFGLVWLLADKEAKEFGRKFVPWGSKSRVQKELGLREGNVVAPANYSTKTGRFSRS